MGNKKSFGNWGESFVRKYLEQNGYQFISNNYRSGRLEIDLIFKQKKNYIFVEVKTRIKNKFSEQENSLSTKQAKNLKIAAANYCHNNKINFETTRHDLIVVLVDELNFCADIIHYKNII